MKMIDAKNVVYLAQKIEVFSIHGETVKEPKTAFQYLQLVKVSYFRDNNKDMIERYSNIAMAFYGLMDGNSVPYDELEMDEDKQIVDNCLWYKEVVEKSGAD